MRVQLDPIAVDECEAGLGGRVLFAVPSGRDFAVDIPGRDVPAARVEFENRSRGPSLFELWCTGSLLDGQYTEVIVEAYGDKVRFSLVFVSDGVIWRTAVDTVDALLTGFHFKLPFFLAEPVAQGRLPTLVKLPKEVPIARFAWMSPE